MEHLYRQYVTVQRASAWAGSQGKRAFDCVCAGVALVALWPVLAVAAIAVRLSSPGPILFRQERSGIAGQSFTIFKFRTMRVQQAGPCVTRKGDGRLTRTGAFLRRWKIDELPQLWNVLRGDMSLVGARPKVPRHQTYALTYRPGITGAASLAFRNEENLLDELACGCLDAYQVEVMMPLKQRLDGTYMRHATFWSDLRILFATATGGGARLNQADLRQFQASLLSLDAALRTSGAAAVQPALETAQAAHL